MKMLVTPPSSTAPPKNPLQDDYKQFPKSKRGTTLWTSLQDEYELNDEERFWRGIYTDLLERGYTLRPRYAPDWTPSWVGTNILPMYCEDSSPSMYNGLIDARRTDGLTVAIKWIPEAAHIRSELSILKFVNSAPLRSDPRNHAVVVLDQFEHPDQNTTGAFIVTPWLGTVVHMPVKHVNEVVDFMLQAFEGLEFLHEHGVAHRDCTGRNIMVDMRSLLPGKQWHPHTPVMSSDMRSSIRPLPRCQATPPARYFFIGFGMASRDTNAVTGTLCRDFTVPELSDTVPYDPFKVDVYTLGNYFLRDFVERHANLAFLRPLLVHMVSANPAARPSISEALQTLRGLAASIPGLSFRWRLTLPAEPKGAKLRSDTIALAREVYYHARSIFLLRGQKELGLGRPKSIPTTAPR